MYTGEDTQEADGVVEDEGGEHDLFADESVGEGAVEAVLALAVVHSIKAIPMNKDC